MKNLSQFKTIVSEYGRSSFVRHFFIVASGTASAQAIGFLTSPIISRLYSPEQFGGLAMFTTLAALLITISSLGYESAIVLPRADTDAVNVFGLSAVLAFGFFLLGGLALIISGTMIWHLLEVRYEDRNYFYALPLVVLANAIGNALVYWNNRQTLFKLNSFYRVVLSVTVATLGILFGLYMKSGNGLIAAFVISNVAISLAFLLLSIRRSGLRLASINRNQIKEQARVFSDFPKYYLVQNFFDAFREYFFVVIINMFFLPATVGAYAFALRIIRVPLNLVSTSISQVSYQKIAAIKNDNGDIYGFVKRLIGILILVSIPIFAVFVLFGPEIFVFVFGNQWYDAGRYTTLLVFWLFANFVAGPISTVPLILGKTRFSFYYTLTFNVVSLGTFFLCSALTKKFELSLLVTSIVSCLYLGFYIFQIVRLAKRGV